MYSNTIMNQLLTLLPRHQFDQAVSDFGGDHYVKKFSTWNQLTVLLYAQAANKNSLCDIQTALETQEPKLYHLGIARREAIDLGRRQRQTRFPHHGETLLPASGALPGHRPQSSISLQKPRVRFRFRHYRPLSGAFLQVDHAAPSDKDVPRHLQERRAHAGLGVHDVLFAPGLHQVSMSLSSLACPLQQLVQNTLLDRLSLIDLLRLPERKLSMLRNTEPQLCFEF